MFIIGEESKTERRESLLAGDAEAHREENVGMTFICVSLFPVVSCSSFAVRSPLLSSHSVVTSLISSSAQYTSSTIREVYLGFGLWTNEGQQKPLSFLLLLFSSVLQSKLIYHLCCNK